MSRTAIVIANWNGKKYLKDCFDSLAGQTFQDFKIIFVDNGSVDGSVGYIEENYSTGQFSNRLEIIRFKKNIGFSAGYNAGIERALEDDSVKHILVLNNDTKLDNDCLEELVKCAKSHPEAGAIQSKVLNFFEKNKIDCVGIVLARDGTAHNRGYGERDEGQYDHAEEIFGANGTASLFSRSALQKTKISEGEFFDNKFFAYYEDSDLAWRLRLAGFKAYICPKSVVWHVHSATAGKHSLFKAYYLHRNYFFVIFKNYPAGIIIKTLSRRLLSYIRLVLNIFYKKGKETGYASGNGKGEVFVAILKAWGSVIANLPGLLEKRRAIQKNRKVSVREIKSWLEKYSAER